jgi:Ran GTPase-activating protein (RanGAP) involved in mRNA processing and transport
VQANHESTKTSSNVTRTLDAIYLRPAQNMDLNSGQLISSNIVHEIPVTDVVIKAVEDMAYQQGLKSLRFKNRNGVIYHDADWIAGVDYGDPDDYDRDDIENEDEEYDNEEEENENQLEQYEELEDQLEHIDPEEIEDIIRDARGETNPNMHVPNNNANEELNRNIQ